MRLSHGLTVLCSAQHGARHAVVGDQSVACLLMSLFPWLVGGGIEAAQWAPPAQRLHGAELPEPEPRPQPAHQPRPGGAGSEERAWPGAHTLEPLAGPSLVGCGLPWTSVPQAPAPARSCRPAARQPGAPLAPDPKSELGAVKPDGRLR